MLGLIGWPDAKQAASTSSRWKRASRSALGARRNARSGKSYNPRTVAQLGKDAPGFDWPTWLKAAGPGRALRSVS
jgi:putative endopeptidase